MQAACKDNRAVAVEAVDLLSQQYFFTSTKLASLATDAEILTKVGVCVCALTMSFWEVRAHCSTSHK